MKLVVQFFILIVSLGGFAFAKGDDSARDVARFRCLETLVRLASDPKNSKIISGPLTWVEGAPESIAGDRPGQVFKAGWKVEEHETDGKIIYGFSDGTHKYSAVLSIDGKKEEPHRIELNFPRDEGGSLTNLSLLEAALKTLYARAKMGEKFELVISDPLIVEQLNTISGEYFANGERVQKTKPKEMDFEGKTIGDEDQVSKPKKAGFQPRRPVDADEAKIFPGVAELDKNADSYFPEFTEAEGLAAISLFNKDRDFEVASSRAISGTDLARAINESGEWIARVKMRTSPRLSATQAAVEVLEFSMPEIYPIVWVVEFEQAW